VGASNISEARLKEALPEIYDPGIAVSIFDLVLIYTKN
jgi:metal-sulfur cluster biosynthetic enzyme